MTLIIAIVGALIFHIAGLPLPFLFGPMAACLIAAFADLKLKDVGPLNIGARGVLGVAVGE